jgi:tripartite-type tricarboxylate transporter receptor subunit TctC
MQDLLAGQIDFMMEPSSNFRSLSATDSIKPIAVTGTARLLSLPNIPTVEEAGLPGFTASLWYGCGYPRRRRRTSSRS